MRKIDRVAKAIAQRLTYNDTVIGPGTVLHYVTFDCESSPESVAVCTTEVVKAGAERMVIRTRRGIMNSTYDGRTIPTLEVALRVNFALTELEALQRYETQVENTIEGLKRQLRQAEVNLTWCEDKIGGILAASKELGSV